MKREFVLVIGLFLMIFMVGCVGALDMEYVLVGDAGNVADTEVIYTDGTTGYGSVDYEFRIGKYEVTNAQYIEFLNAVAKTDPNSLYNTLIMPGVYGGIDRSGSSGNYTYSVKGGDTNWLNRPVNGANWYDALRFANWMHNGQPTGNQDDSTTEDGAYDLSLGSGVFRKTGAKVWLPSEDEWYKAAYYKGGGTDEGYWRFPTQSDIKPTSELPPGTDSVSGSANLAQQQNIPMDPVYKTTEVGAYTFKPLNSSYGTFDQAGNLHEWEDSFRSFKGGSFETARYNDSASSYRFLLANPSKEEDYGIGFRVASIVISEPESNLTLYEYHNTGEDDDLTGIYPIYWPGQTFTVGTVGINEDFNILQVRVKVHSRGSPGTCYFSIRETSEGSPIGLDLSIGSFDGNSITTNIAGEWYSINMSPYILQASTQYALVAGCPSGSEDDINSIRWIRDNDDGYNNGNKFLSTDSGVTWPHTYSNEDLMFEILGESMQLSDTERIELLERQVENLTERVQGLEDETQEQEERIDILESAVSLLQSTVNILTNKVNSYLTYLPMGFKEKMLCGYLEENNETAIDGFGLHCEMDGQKCVCDDLQ